jgi:uncharacterized membrane protein YhhN
MSRRLRAYVVLAAADTVLAGLGARRARRLTKPLLMPLLAASVPHAPRDLQVAVALSGGGDVALLSEDDSAFLAGLASFLGGHLAYVRVLDRLRRGERDLPVTIAVGVAGAAQAAALARPAGSLAAPVLAYSAVISAMGSAALSVRPLDPSERDAVRWVKAGALLFMLSDSLVGARRFRAPSRWERPLDAAVMATYTAAQWLLVSGSARLDSRRMR